jgi:hypothetical protein
MSVPVGKRSKSKLEVYVKALELAKYTLLICGNEKHFPKRDRWMVTNKIVESVIDVAKNISMANSIRVSIRADFELRRKLQTSALSSTSGLLTLIELAYVKYNLDGDRVLYWTGLVTDVQTLLRSWRNSDLQRYKHLMEDYR